VVDFHGDALTAGGGDQVGGFFDRFALASRGGTFLRAFS
jgi:hypothetical protein